MARHECEIIGCHATASNEVADGRYHATTLRRVCRTHYALITGAVLPAPVKLPRGPKEPKRFRPPKRAIAAPANLPLPQAFCACGESRPADAAECRRCEGRAEVEQAEALALADYGPRVPRCDRCLVAVGAHRPGGLLLCDACAPEAETAAIRPETTR